MEVQVLSTAPYKLGKNMYYKLFLAIISFLTINLLKADNYMMNCTSPDYKNTSFYKYSNTDRYLFVRPMKNKWRNFCEVNFKNEKDISCNFDKLNILRSSIIEEDDIYIEKTLENKTGWEIVGISIAAGPPRSTKA